MSAYFESLNRRRAAAVAPALVPVPAPPLARVAVRRSSAPATPPAAYVELRESLRVTGASRPQRSVVFAGSAGPDGTDRMVHEFAECLAAIGLRVLVVQGAGSGYAAADHPVADLAGLLAAGGAPPEECVGPGRLAVVRAPAGSAESEALLASPALPGWLDAQRARFAYILIEAAPVLLAADAALFGRLCDGVALVAQAAATTARDLARARDRLRQAGVTVLGVVVTDVRDDVPRVLKPLLAVS